jgi:uncharacterized protein (TIGR00251 family)
MVAVPRTIRIKVKPNARKSELVLQGDGIWLARVAAPPIDGQANNELVALVARHFGLRRTQVSIRTGASGRIKTIDLVSAHR